MNKLNDMVQAVTASLIYCWDKSLVPSFFKVLICLTMNESCVAKILFKISGIRSKKLIPSGRRENLNMR